jgi:hypothetical protein
MIRQRAGMLRDQRTDVEKADVNEWLEKTEYAHDPGQFPM